MVNKRKTTFLEELGDRLRLVRLEALPDIVAAIDRATSSSGAQPRGAQPQAAEPADLDALARSVLRLSVKGSKLEALQGAVIAHALETCGGNISAAARLLGVDRNAFKRRAARHIRAHAKR